MRTIIRKSWDVYFLEIALKVAERSTCSKAHVGCVLVKDKRIIATGYNGSIYGLDHCDDVGHLLNAEGRCIRTIHAEQNALIQCAKYGVQVEGAIAYVTHEPCETCSKLLNQASVTRIVYAIPYKNDRNRLFVEGITLEHIPIESEAE